MLFKTGDIVSTALPYTPAVFVITGVDPKGDYYDATNIVKKGKRYRLTTNIVKKGKRTLLTEELLTKIGDATADYMKDLDKVEELVVLPALFEAGRLRAERELKQHPWGLGVKATLQWQVLASAKTGDKFNIRTREGVEEVTFCNVILRGHKFVFIATNRSGKTYKYPLDLIVVD